MELWDVYDQCMRKTGRLHERGIEVPAGDYHLVVHIFPVNDKKEILIQKRSDTVAWKPGMWAATGGSVIAGEDMYQACVREFSEELGITAGAEDMELAAIFKRETSFNSVWVIRCNTDLSELKLQKEEVAEAKWASIEEIKEMMEQGIFHIYSYFDWLSMYITQMKY